MDSLSPKQLQRQTLNDASSQHFFEDKIVPLWSITGHWVTNQEPFIA